MYEYVLCYVTVGGLERNNYCHVEKSIERGIFVWLLNWAKIFFYPCVSHLCMSFFILLILSSAPPPPTACPTMLIFYFSPASNSLGAICTSYRTASNVLLSMNEYSYTKVWGSYMQYWRGQKLLLCLSTTPSWYLGEKGDSCTNFCLRHKMEVSGHFDTLSALAWGN